MKRSDSGKLSSGNSNLQHVCKVCNRLLTSPYKLREHMMIHTGEKPHVCKQCNSAFRTKPDLARHIRIHTGERPYQCKLCSQSFHRSDNLRGHMKVHKDRQELRCHFCGDHFPLMTELMKHKCPKRNPDKKFDATSETTTGEDTNDSDKLVIATEVTDVQKSEDAASEESVSKTVKAATPYRSTPVAQSDGRPSPERKEQYQFVCPDCGSTFFQKGALAMHVKLVHGSGGSRSGSPNVSLPSTPSPAPDMNYIAKASSTVYLCSTCGQSFGDLLSLDKHTTDMHSKNWAVDMNQNHTKVDENMNHNEDEGWTLQMDSDAELSDSEEAVTDENNTLTDDGGVSGNSVGIENLSGTVMQNENAAQNLSVVPDKPHVCGDCGQTFAWKQDLNRHTLTIHSGKVPYRCTICGRGFLRQDRLISHIRVHTGKSPHTCEHCHKTFTASSSLKEHMKIHTGEKPHHCYICGKDFRQKCVLTRHVKNVHKVELDQAIYPPADSNKHSQEVLPLNTQHANMNIQPIDLSEPEPMDFSISQSKLLTTHMSLPTTTVAPSPPSDASENSEVKNSEENIPTSTTSAFATNTPILLEHLNHAKKSSPNHIKVHSCAACNMMFASVESLSNHLMTKHVMKVKAQDASKVSNGYYQNDKEGVKTGAVLGEVIFVNEYQESLSTSDGYGNSKRIPNVTVGGYSSSSSISQSASEGSTQSFNQAFRRSELTCGLCGFMFSTSEELSAHTDKHLTANPFFCSLCSDTFRSTSDLEDHIIKTHTDLIERLKNLNDNDLMDSSFEGGISCSVCREQLEEESELAEHMQIHCPGKDGENFSCTMCSQDFETAEVMNSHFSQQHGCSPGSGFDMRVFGCNFCYKPFKTVRTLVLHLKSHLLEKKHVCQVCGKAFSQAVYLKQHIRTHTGEKPYKCHFCSRGFTQKTQLTLHERQHRGETPFSCERCGKAFTNKSVLKLHFITHFALPPYRCNVCRRRFTQAGNVRRHIQMRHKDIKNGDDPLYTCDWGGNLATERELREKDAAECDSRGTQTPKSDLVGKQTTESDFVENQAEESDKGSVEIVNLSDSSDVPDTQPLDLTLLVDNPPSGKVSKDNSDDAVEISEEISQQSEPKNGDNDDLIVMGAYYQQQHNSSCDSDLAKDSNADIKDPKEETKPTEEPNVEKEKDIDLQKTETKSGSKRKCSEITEIEIVTIEEDKEASNDITPKRPKRVLRKTAKNKQVNKVVSPRSLRAAERESRKAKLIKKTPEVLIKKTAMVATVKAAKSKVKLAKAKKRKRQVQKTCAKCVRCVQGFCEPAIMNAHLDCHHSRVSWTK